MADSPARALLAQAFEHHAAGRMREAEAAYEQALASDAANPDALAALASLRLARGSGAEAVALCDRALAADPRHAAALINRGNALRAGGLLGEALASYDACVAAHPSHAQAWSNRAVILSELRRHDQALDSCERAIALSPGSSQAHNTRGIALAALGRPHEAVESYDRALAIDALDVAAHNNRALALMGAFRMHEALEAAERAIALQPRFAAAHFTRGSVLRELRRPAEALESFEAAAALAPGIPYVQGARLFLRMQLCEWDGIDALHALVERGISAGQRMMHPWALLATPSSAATQRRCAEIFVADRWPAPAPPLPARAPGERIRIGYFSADFHAHATAYLIAELIELHDRSRFEVVAFSFGTPSSGAMRTRLRAAFDEFIDVAHLPDAQIAALSRRRGIDIAVDLKGLTQDARPGIFALRAAPVQVNFLGHPGTTGARFIDYILADETLIPHGRESDYTERVARVAGCYQPNDRLRAIAPRRPPRRELGLPEEGFVFCCFNASYKIWPDTFAVWMSLLRALPGSVLWLLAPEATAVGRLRRAATNAGVDPERIVFAESAPLPEHLARIAQADLFLDTFHCGAHTTASDALWAGVPVVTLPGEAFASRVAASLLRAVALPQLIADSVEGYASLALDLARSPARLGAIRQQLAQSRLGSELFDTPGYARRLEAAYVAMLDAQRAQ
jgi:predicted O-linked N-acetylglucosamine transferase (SPINDLY family)